MSARPLAGVLDRDDLAEDPDFATNPKRLEHRNRLIPELDRAIDAWERAPLLAACEAEGVPAGPINDLAEVFADPQVIARGQQIAPGGIPGVRSPIRFAGETADDGHPSPALGADQDLLGD